MRAQKARTATCALDVEVCWRDETVLRHDHLCPPRPYLLSEQATRDPEASFVVGSEWLPAQTHELVSVDGETITVHGPRGSSKLTYGEQTVVHFGALSFHVRLSQPGTLPAGARAFAADPKQHAWTAASLALHAIMLGCMAFMPPKASSLSLDAASSDTRYARYLAMPVEPEELPWQPEPGLDGARDQPKDAAPHKGATGKAGSEHAPKTDRRMGIQGNDALRMPPKLSAANAGEQGILGVLSSMQKYVGPTSEFGGIEALGYDAESAIGALHGAIVGENFGFNGLGQHGTGRWGGGDVAGTVGVGTLQTGEAARGTPGSRTLTGMRRESRVPTLKPGVIETRGSLSKEVIRRTIHMNLHKVRHCYEQALSARPDLSGRVSVRFLIAPSGVVQQSLVAESTLGNDETARCVAKVVSILNFPAPDGGGYVTVTYPFLFEQAE